MKLPKAVLVCALACALLPPCLSLAGSNDAEEEAPDPFEDLSASLSEMKAQFLSDASEWHKASKREFVRKKLSLLINKARTVQKIVNDKGVKTGEINLPGPAMRINSAYGAACEKSGRENSRDDEFRNTLKAEARSIEKQLEKLRAMGIDSADAEKVDPAALEPPDPFVEFLSNLKEIKFQFLSNKDSEWHKDFKREEVLKFLADFTNKSRLLQKTVNDKGVPTGEINLPRFAMAIYNAYQDACERIGKESTRDSKFQSALLKASAEIYSQLAKLKEMGIAPSSLSLIDKKPKKKKGKPEDKGKTDDKKGKDKKLDLLPDLPPELPLEPAQ